MRRIYLIFNTVPSYFSWYPYNRPTARTMRSPLSYLWAVTRGYVPTNHNAEYETRDKYEYAVHPSETLTHRRSPSFLSTSSTAASPLNNNFTQLDLLGNIQFFVPTFIASPTWITEIPETEYRSLHGYSAITAVSPRVPSRIGKKRVLHLFYSFLAAAPARNSLPHTSGSLPRHTRDDDSPPS